MQKEREERRNKMEEQKQQKRDIFEKNQALGKKNDVDFEMLVDQARYQQELIKPHCAHIAAKIAVCVRKRIIFKKEMNNGEIDSVSVANPMVKVHANKYKVDGITKYVENSEFQFDNAFNENESTQDVYNYSLQPIIQSIFNKGLITVFAYGQTGSGKTYTMRGIQDYLTQDIFGIMKQSKTFKLFITSYELYGGRALDLLNQRNQLNIMEDKNGQVQITNVVEKQAYTQQDLTDIIDEANALRTTHSTSSNDVSSRSHLICKLSIRTDTSFLGSLVLVDLAGSERAIDCQSNNRQRRLEGAEINKSLLALKECIRSMDNNAQHIPFRASKLTQVLRDSFINKSHQSRVIMIACISPGNSSADHTINTLRYADRLKENKPIQNGNEQASNNIIQQQQRDIQKQIQLQEKLDQELKVKQEKDFLKQQEFEKKERLKQEKIQKEQESKQQKLINEQQKKEVLEQQKQQRIKEIKEKKQQQKKGTNIENGEKKKIVSMEEPIVSKHVIQDQQENIKLNNQKSKEDIKPSQNQNTPANQQQKEEPLPAINQNNQIKVFNQQQSKEILSNVNKKKMNSEQNSNSREEENPVELHYQKDDVNCMRMTLKGNKQDNDNFFEFQDKVSCIMEEQEEIFATHMAAIKEDAKLLTKESELIQNVQGIGFVDYDIDLYAQNLESVIKKKLKMYNLLNTKLQTFKNHLREEEEISSKVKDHTFYNQLGN